MITADLKNPEVDALGNRLSIRGDYIYRDGETIHAGSVVPGPHFRFQFASYKRRHESGRIDTGRVEISVSDWTRLVPITGDQFCDFWSEEEEADAAA